MVLCARRTKGRNGKVQLDREFTECYGAAKFSASFGVSSATYAEVRNTAQMFGQVAESLLSFPMNREALINYCKVADELGAIGILCLNIRVG